MHCGHRQAAQGQFPQARHGGAQARLLDHRRVLAAAETAADEREQLRMQVHSWGLPGLGHIPYNCIPGELR